LDGLLDWYLLGVALGLGIAAGVPGPRRDVPRALTLAVIGACAVAAGVIAVLATGWAIIAALAGVAIGVFAFRRLSAAAVPAAALGIAVLALVPVLGYAVAALAPFLGERLRRRAGDRYAGLRILAKD
jgi:hypothetical protein